MAPRRDGLRRYRLVSLDAGDSRSWHEQLADELRQQLANYGDPLPSAGIVDSEAAQRVVACAAGERDPIVERLWQAAPRLRPSPQQRVIAASLDERVAALAIPYLLGHLPARKLGRRRHGPALKPLAEAMGKKSAYQSMNTQVRRVAPRLRATLALVHVALQSEDEFAATLLTYAPDGWRRGTVGLLTAEREHLATVAPDISDRLAVASARLGELAFEILDKTISMDGDADDISDFLKVYQVLRFAALFHPKPFLLRDRIRSRLSSLPEGPSIKCMWLERALKRSLHLLMSREEWASFIDELLDWAAEPSGYGGAFAMYEASYYQDELSPAVWQGLGDPYSLESAWSGQAVKAVVEQSEQNTHEPWYGQPHHAAINMLRAVTYLRAHPGAFLTPRERIALTHIARHARLRAGRLDHPQRSAVLGWSSRLERYAQGNVW